MTLTITEEAAPAGFEALLRIEAPEAGLNAFICLHSTALGPAAGGCRMWNYADQEDARRDVLRLAEGMTSKNALADLGLGGGKAVIIGDARNAKTPALLRAFGQAVDQLDGRYYTAEDVGMSADDMAIVASQTPYAVGLTEGDYASGDPSPHTAEGVFQCLLSGARHVFGSADLTGRRVLVQGLGHVGYALAEKLSGAGATLLVSDLNEAALARAKAGLGAEIVSPEEALLSDAEIFAPCALGGILTIETAAHLQAKLVCGAANNQLDEPRVADTLRARGIRYLPDYVVNAGGIISVAGEIHKSGQAYRAERIAGVAARIEQILAASDSTGRSTTQIAAEMVEQILASAQTAKTGAA